MTPESAPTVQQLLAFYLEAGVDCALTEEPVNRLADPDVMPAAPEEASPPPPRTGPAANPSAAKPAPRAARQRGRRGPRSCRRGRRPEPRLRSTPCARYWKNSTAAR